MAVMTSQKLKKALQVEKWSEINTPKQFYVLMQNFYNLTPVLKKKIISEINDLKKMTDDFMRLCIDGIVDYEPSIMIAMIDQGENIKKALSSETKVSSSKKKTQILEMYNGFSHWFSVSGEVQCSCGKDEIICSISDAVKMAIENDQKEQKETIAMLLLTKARRSLLEAQESKLLSDMGWDEDLIFDLFGDEADLLGFERSTAKYLN